MFQCERCGSSYSSAHSVGIENCPRCLLRDRTVARLSFKVFDLPERERRQAARPQMEAKDGSAAPAAEAVPGRGDRA